MGRVEGKVVIVTGAASGLGAADARLLAREGAQVILTDINAEGGSAVADEVGGHFVEQDVSSEQGWRTLIADTVDRYGRLDVLVNNAGIAAVADIEATTTETWRRILSIHLDATFFGCKYAIAAMKESGGGSLINISSTAALIGFGPYFAYSAAKGGIRSMSKSIAQHCKVRGYGIRCNSVHPGGIDTPLLHGAIQDLAASLSPPPEGAPPPAPTSLEIGRPEDVANMVVFLASDESRHVNGAELVVDNGESAF